MELTFDSHIKHVRILADKELPHVNAQPVQWLVPGFINAHCHLEYSWLGAAPLPRGPVPFGQWMQSIMAARPSGPSDVERRESGMADAAKALLRGGCTAVIDSTTDGSSGAHLDSVGLRHFIFHEALGLSRERAEPIWRDMRVQLQSKAIPGAVRRLIGRGINPHAPYSVGPWLRGQLLSEEATAWPQAWHLGETLDEDALFFQGNGSIAELLKAGGMRLPFFSDESDMLDLSDVSDLKPPGVSAFRFLQITNQLERCQMAFHGNTLALRQATWFSGNRALVHCPATHRWFAREPAPLREWLDAGVNVCLGTDSLASSETLSMLEIIRMTLLDNRDLSADDVLRMSCTNPAQISFMTDAGFTGLLEPGSFADFVALEAPGSCDNWLDAMTDNQTGITKVWISGDEK